MAAKKRAAKKAPKAPRPAPETAAEAPPPAAAAADVEVKKEELSEGKQKVFLRGDRVMVIRGEWGNSRGTVVSMDRVAIAVVLDSMVRKPAMPFLRENLKRC